MKSQMKTLSQRISIEVVHVGSERSEQATLNNREKLRAEERKKDCLETEKYVCYTVENVNLVESSNLIKIFNLQQNVAKKANYLIFMLLLSIPFKLSNSVDLSLSLSLLTNCLSLNRHQSILLENYMDSRA